MYLAEYVETIRNKDLDYLGEYLIEQQFITLEEARNLLEAAEVDKEKLLKALKAKFNVKMKKFHAAYSKRWNELGKKIKDPKKLAAARKKLDAKYEYTVKNWNKSYAFSKKNIVSRFGRAKGAIYTAYKMMPKSGKVAAGLAGAGLAAGAGYGAYKAAKKK